MTTTSNEGRPTVYRILFAIALVHLFNDSIQAVIPAIYPILKKSMLLTFTQIGLIGFAINITASVMQPIFGLYTDRKPSPFFLPIGMTSTFLGMLGLAFAPNYSSVILSVILVGIGSAVFHPEGSRVAYLAAGSRRGLAQSIYQVGGNSGQSLAPIMTALVFVPLGQFGAIWFTVVAAAAIVVQLMIAKWYRGQINTGFLQRKKPKSSAHHQTNMRTIWTMVLLVFLVFARSWYHAGITNFYPFFLMHKYGITISQAQIYIFLFLAAGALGTFLGGPLADRFGRRNIIFFSMLGSAPLALVLPYANLFWALIICLVNGFIVLSSFSVTVVYGQELFPGKIGTISGLIIGLAFGMGAIGAAALGSLIDTYSLSFVMKLVGFLPFIGLMSIFLPSDKKIQEWQLS